MKVFVAQTSQNGEPCFCFREEYESKDKERKIPFLSPLLFIIQKTALYFQIGVSPYYALFNWVFFPSQTLI
jgi:hypothetical protein